MLNFGYTPFANRFLLLFGLLFIAPLSTKAAVYTVTSAANGTTTDGVSLRWAITQANSSNGNTIVFDIPGSAPHTITLTGALPTINRNNITIDGSTQPANGYIGSAPRIIIDGNGTISRGIQAISTRDDIQLYGLYITGFTDYGIYLPGKETHTIGAPGKGNIISGNGDGGANDAGIFLKGGTLQANIIGMEADGITPAPNNGHGIFGNGGKIILGGSSSGEGNLISANTGHGVFMTSCSYSIVQGNHIGTDINGIFPFGNGGSGIHVVINSRDVLIGGGGPGQGNTISGNGSHGIFNDTGNDMIIKGNKIGSNTSGTHFLGNTGDGIHMTSHASRPVIGGTTPEEGNIISGNANGIYLSGPDDGIIQGNHIGTGTTGTENIGNIGYGIYITNNSDGHLIGGPVPGASNRIAHNGNSGIGIDAQGGIMTDDNIISRNSIFCNASQSNQLGIALIENGNDGVLAPVITNVTSTTVTGTSGSNAVIELFKDADNCAGCQGKFYLGTTTANSAGDWTFTAEEVCGRISATATFPSGTSPFSACTEPLEGATLDFTASADTVNIGDTVVFQNTSTGFPAGTKFVWVFQDCLNAQSTIVIDDHPACGDTTIGLAPMEHTYPIPGTYRVILKALDCQGYPFEIPAPRELYITAEDRSVEECAPNCNLVCNGDFEAGTCPTAYSQINKADSWTQTTEGTSDYFKTCSSSSKVGVPVNGVGIQTPRSGESYAGIYMVFGDNWFDYKEYLETTLNTPMVAGITYHVRMYVSLSEVSGLAIDGVGILFTNVRPPAPSPFGDETILATPSITLQKQGGGFITDTENWVLLCGNYTAMGGETLMIIGDYNPFFAHANPVTPSIHDPFLYNPPIGYYYFDDISVEEFVADAGQDITTCPGLEGEIGTDCRLSDAVYSWSPATGLSCTDCPNPIASPAVTTTYTVTVTDPSGCAPTVMDEVTVTVKEVTVDAGNDITLCPLTPGGPSPVLGATSNQVPDNGTYVWSPAGSCQDPACSLIEISPQQTTTYTVTYTSPEGCVATDEVTVFISNPSVEINQGGIPLVCEGNCFDLNAAGSAGTPPYTYNWSSGHTGAGPHSVCPVGSTTYTVTLTDAAGCTATAQVLVNPNPAPVIDAGDDVVICEGVSTQLNATGAISFSWSPAAGLSCTNCPNPIASPTVTTVYTVTGTSPEGCVGTATVEVDVEPAPTLSTYTLTKAGCSELEGTFTADENDIAGGNSPFTFLWNTVPPQTTLNATGLVAGTHILTITDAIGCVANLQVTVENQHPCPVPDSLPVSNYSDCEEWLNCAFFASLPAGTKLWIEIWPVKSGPNATVQYSRPCGTSYSVVAVNEDPNASHWPILTTNQFMAPVPDVEDMINVDDIPPHCQPVGSFMPGFIDMDNLPNFDAPPIDFYLVGATYTVRFHIRDAGGFWYDVDVCLYVDPSGAICLDNRFTGHAMRPSKDRPSGQAGNEGLQQEAWSEKNARGLAFNLYPNPNDGNMQLDYDLREGERGELIITDLTGRKVAEYKLEAGKQRQAVSEYSLQSGTYLYRVLINGEIVKTERLIIVR